MAYGFLPPTSIASAYGEPTSPNNTTKCIPDQYTGCTDLGANGK
eukprot:CAMPEP_0183732378 /NCGR_PEP_ID=MMETSP0737-20130205/38321_1 /TAXON_ID=385413 /ORGANISM="Thalassiosira miniscula, Strain CCMP1093" /LENGTH=43 /DNA_ID= /DNA_START= /DNA_END= /DNA_ORIENTATION=